MKLQKLFTILIAIIVTAPLTLSFTSCTTNDVGRHFKKRGNQAESIGRGVGRSSVDLHESHVKWWKRNTN